MAPGGRRQVLLRFWQTWLTPNMSTATLQTILFNHLSPIMHLHIYTKFIACHPQVLVWQMLGPSGSIMVKISLDGSNYLFCASPAGRRKWLRNWASQLTPTDLRQMRRQSRVSFTSPERLRGLCCGCGNCWDTKEIIGNKPTLPSSHHLLLTIAFTKALFYTFKRRISFKCTSMEKGP